MRRRRLRKLGLKGNAKTQGVNNQAEPDGSAFFFHVLMTIPKEGLLLGK